MIILDKWDCEMIHYWKHASETEPVTLDGMRKIWGERCGIDAENWPIIYIVEHFLKLAYKLDLFDGYFLFTEFILDLEQSKNWKFTCLSNLYLTKETADYQLIVLSRLQSLFSLANVNDLPGYRDFLEKNT